MRDKDTTSMDSQSLIHETRFLEFFSKMNRIRHAKYGVIIMASLALYTDMAMYGCIVPLLPEILDRVSFPSDKYSIGSTTLFAMYGLGLVVATPVFGILSDRYHNRKIPMLIGLCGVLTTTTLFSMCHSYAELMVARVCQGTFSSFIFLEATDLGISAAATWVVGMAMVAETFPKEKLGSIMGLVQTFNTLGFVSGPIIGGYLGAFAGIESPFYFGMALAGLGLLTRLFFEAPTDLIESAKDHSVKESQEPLNNTMIHLWRHTEVALLSIAVTICSSSFSIMESLISDYLQSHFSLSLTAATNVICCIILPYTLFSYFIGAIGDRFKRTRLIFLGLIAHSVVSPFLALTDALWIFCILCVVFSITYSMIFTSALPEMANTISNLGYKTNSYAKIYAIVSICYSIGMLIGPLTAGYVMKSWGLFWTLFIIPLITTFFLPTYLIFTLKMERKHKGLDDTYRQVFKNFWKDLINIKQPKPSENWEVNLSNSPNSSNL